MQKALYNETCQAAARLPQPFKAIFIWLVTFMSGLPLAAGPYPTAKYRIGFNLACVLIIIPVSMTLAIQYDLGIAVYLFLALLQTGQMRWAQLVTVHQAAHAKQDSRLCLVGHFISALLIIEPFKTRDGKGYQPGHGGQHHVPLSLSTLADPTVQFLVYILRIHPGLPVETLRLHFVFNLFSPIIHGRILFNRVLSNFRTVSKFPKIALLTQLAVLGALVVLGHGKLVFWVWLLPISLGFQMAQILRLPVEHLWRPANAVYTSKKEMQRSLTPVNILFEPFPDRKAPFSDYIIYSLRQFLNLFVRVVAFPRDSSFAHAFHHENVKKDVGMAETEAFQFHEFQRAHGQPMNPVNLGYLPALDRFFKSVEAASHDSIMDPTSRSST